MKVSCREHSVKTVVCESVLHQRPRAQVIMHGAPSQAVQHTHSLGGTAIARLKDAAEHGGRCLYAHGPFCSWLCLESSATLRELRMKAQRCAFVFPMPSSSYNRSGICAEIARLLGETASVFHTASACLRCMDVSTGDIPRLALPDMHVACEDHEPLDCDSWLEQSCAGINWKNRLRQLVMAFEFLQELCSDEHLDATWRKKIKAVRTIIQDVVFPMAVRVNLMIATWRDALRQFHAHAERIQFMMNLRRQSLKLQAVGYGDGRLIAPLRGWIVFLCESVLHEGHAVDSCV